MPTLNSRSITAEELEQLHAYLPDFSAIQKALSLSSIGIVEDAQRLVQSQMKNILEAFKTLDTGREILKGFTLPSIYWSVHYTRELPIEKEHPILPAISHTSTVKRARLGLKALPGGSFSYKRTILKGIATTKSLYGALLSYLIDQPTFFASDEEIGKELRIEGYRDLSYVVRDLKKAFRKNALKLVIERRRRPDGYQLIGVEILH